MSKRYIMIKAHPDFKKILEEIKEEEEKSFRLITRDMARNMKNKRRRIIL